MRAICLLLALYVFGLSLTTCTDGAYADTCGTADTHYHVTQDQQHDDACCSPFCVCACCSSVIVTQFAYAFSAPHDVMEQIAVPVIDFSSADRAAIWQPPKIG